MISGFKFAVPALLLLNFAASAYAGDTARAYMRQGLKAYNVENYDDALTHFKKASAEFPHVSAYNLGNTYYRMGDYAQATNSYHKALESDDLELQAQVYYNLGNALLEPVAVTNYAERVEVDQAVELTVEAAEMFENALRLNPNDLAAKQNYERSLLRRTELELNLGKYIFDQAESLLQEYKAKEAQGKYIEARNQFERILAEINPTHAEAKQYLPKIEERLNMLERAVETAENDLQIALQQIDDYQYVLAAQRLMDDSDERKYAFDIKPELKKKYEETIQKNQEIIQIIENLSSLNQTVI
ncbi:MAG: tetratricopeptide repeat protein [Lentisphaerae bacterium]|jgi:tetratricopeptide (TPR) repeat protein|nr:tetratricopeptide repeat protein [Lentisphaerota bacterium]